MVQIKLTAPARRVRVGRLADDVWGIEFARIAVVGGRRRALKTGITLTTEAMDAMVKLYALQRWPDRCHATPARI